MKIIDNRVEQSKELEVGDIVKGNVSGNYYLIYRQKDERVNALDLRCHAPLSANGYDSIENKLFLGSFQTDFLVKSHEITITLGVK
jgi:hypothetical protein